MILNNAFRIRSALTRRGTFSVNTSLGTYTLTVSSTSCDSGARNISVSNKSFRAGASKAVVLRSANGVITAAFVVARINADSIQSITKFVRRAIFVVLANWYIIVNLRENYFHEKLNVCVIYCRTYQADIPRIHFHDNFGRNYSRNHDLHLYKQHVLHKDFVHRMGVDKHFVYKLQ